MADGPPPPPAPLPLDGTRPSYPRLPSRAPTALIRLPPLLFAIASVAWMARSMTTRDPIVDWLDTGLNVVVANCLAYFAYDVVVVVFAALMRHNEKRPPSLAVLAGAVATYGGAYLVFRKMGIVP